MLHRHKIPVLLKLKIKGWAKFVKKISEMGYFNARC